MKSSSQIYEIVINTREKKFSFDFCGIFNIFIFSNILVNPPNISIDAQLTQKKNWVINQKKKVPTPTSRHIPKTLKAIKNHVMSLNDSNQTSKEYDSDEDDHDDSSTYAGSSCGASYGGRGGGSDKVPGVVNFSVNLVITFALSLSIYLLMANVFLTYNKISNIKNSGILLGHINSAGFFTPASESMRGAGGGQDKSYQYYDCTKSLLTSEECELLNSYHDEYLNTLRLYLTRRQSATNVLGGNEPAAFMQHNSLKVNTSFFVH